MIQHMVGWLCKVTHRRTCWVSYLCSRSQRFNDWYWKGPE